MIFGHDSIADTPAVPVRELREHRLEALEKALGEARAQITLLESEVARIHTAQHLTVKARQIARILDEMATAGTLRAFALVTYELHPGNGNVIGRARWMTCSKTLVSPERVLEDVKVMLKESRDYGEINPPPGGPPQDSDPSAA